MGKATSRRVVKLGGSLLSLPDLPARLTLWLQSQSHKPTAIIVGGGHLVDAMRELDARFELDQAGMHWRCVQLLDHTCEVVAELLPNFGRVSTAEELTAWILDPSDKPISIVAVSTFYSCGNEIRSSLTASWATTTDSIAAELATRIQADELVLLKSRSLPQGTDLTEAAELEFVDEQFPVAAASIADVRFVDLRSFDVVSNKES